MTKAPYYPGRYDLIENFAENFTTANENNKESVFELQYSSDGELTWGNESGINLGNSLPTFVGPVAAGGWAFASGYLCWYKYTFPSIAMAAPFSIRPFSSPERVTGILLFIAFFKSSSACFQICLNL